jgi:hypothetical protein
MQKTVSYYIYMYDGGSGRRSRLRSPQVPVRNAELNHVNGSRSSDMHHRRSRDLNRNEAGRGRLVEHSDSGGACLKVVPLRATCGRNGGHPDQSLCRVPLLRSLRR